eukprot:Lithocolla_globosa_v1_NODE_4333_length_1460_cov_23.298221.p1 type:complete len:157 gc:universal NODE_4333_length_1460_cov_23.298221:1169-699(-)
MTSSFLLLRQRQMISSLVILARTWLRRFPNPRMIRTHSATFRKKNKLVSMYLYLPTLTEILQEIRNLNPNKRGNDQLQTRLIRDAAPVIAPYLLHVCEVSFRKGVFPNSMKSARVTPLFKTDDPTDPANYRPISVLPTFSKIFERLPHPSGILFRR